MIRTDLRGKRALVCGSTQGIGKASAYVLAANGAEVVLMARNRDKLIGIAEDLPRPFDQEHRCIAVDFSHTRTLKDLLSHLLGEVGSVHIVINNTGGPPGGPITEATEEGFLAAFRMHLLANQEIAKLCSPGMASAGYGRIINIISTSVKQPLKGLGVSNTIRGAVASWSKTLAGELGHHGITVNNVLPGATRTERLTSIIKNKANKAGSTVEEAANQMLAAIPAARFAEAEEIANVVLFLAGPEASYINGINLPVDGGRLSCL